MDRFGRYARYYDLLYKDKDYTGEAGYVNKLIKLYSPHAAYLLNLGCGTGKHDYVLARGGYHVTGVDMSAEMVAQAIDNTPDEIRPQLDFVNGDARSANLQKTFDAVVSLFHVLSYQVSNQDAADMIDTACRHLEVNGLFIFDCWYGPGVMTDPPEVRTKQMADEAITVTRLAVPVVHSLQNVVDVNYTIKISEAGSDEVTEIKELHRMRYFFVPEIELLIKNKFKLLSVKEWLTDAEPTLTSWNAVFVLQKI
ncbi:MAG TPA: class I SAM-dependent methyltransferase [Mucilaginibacter sp.]|jgi:SAM-dependent methyltransferase|nr:class I SAM-dependent methyltransferase [Mucilaginibacter sp.]